MNAKQRAAVARATRSLQRASVPQSKPPTTRRPPNAPYSRSQFLKALEGSGGIKSRIAERLRTTPAVVNTLLHRPDWDDMREAFDAERERVIDTAEQTIKEAIENKADPVLATQNARWYLDRMAKARGYGSESKVTVEGGDKPIRTASVNVIAVETLNLPVELRRQLLAAVEQKEQDAAANDSDEG